MSLAPNKMCSASSGRRRHSESSAFRPSTVGISLIAKTYCSLPTSSIAANATSAVLRQIEKHTTTQPRQE